MAVDLEFTDTSDVPKAGATSAWGTTPPGSASVEFEERIWNGRASSADTATDVLLIPMAQHPVTLEFVTFGVDLLERRGVQVQVTKKNSVDVTEEWRNVGTGAPLLLPDLPDGEYHQYKARALPPAGASEVTTQWKFGIALLRRWSVGDPFIAEDGIHLGVGRGRTTGIYSRSTTIGTTGNATLSWPDYVGYYDGVPVVVLDNDETVPETDGDSATLATTESYIFLTVWTASGPAIVKGSKAVGPTYPDDAPALPAGNRQLGWGEKFAAVDATAMTHTETDAEADFFHVSTSALNATVARSVGPLLAEGSKIDTTTSGSATLTASSTNTVQYLTDGTGAVTTDGTLAQEGAAILFDIVTDGSGETSRTDRRKWAGGHVFEFFVDSPTGTTTVVRRNPYRRDLLLRPWTDQLELDAVPGAGNVKCDLFTKGSGARVTLFTSSGTDDRRPIVQSGDSQKWNEGLPEVLRWPAGETMECDFIVTAATPGYACLTFIADQE